MERSFMLEISSISDSLILEFTLICLYSRSMAEIINNARQGQFGQDEEDIRVKKNAAQNREANE